MGYQIGKELHNQAVRMLANAAQGARGEQDSPYYPYDPNLSAVGYFASAIRTYPSDGLDPPIRVGVGERYAPDYEATQIVTALQCVSALGRMTIRLVCTCDDTYEYSEGDVTIHMIDETNKERMIRFPLLGEAAADPTTLLLVLHLAGTCLTMPEEDASPTHQPELETPFHQAFMAPLPNPTELTWRYY